MFAILFGVVAWASPTCMTSNCHASMKSAAFVHAPIKSESSCVVCHKVAEEGPKHPKLVPIDKPNINKLCLTCHDTLLSALRKQGSSIHSALKKNTCLGCHDPHKSKLPHLTGENPKFTLCYGCHKEIGHQQEKATHHKIEKNMEKGCSSCHNPHAAPNAKLLIKKPAELCLTCHDKEINKDGRVIGSIKGFSAGHVHEPVAKGECIKCHDVHGSQKVFLLQKAYSPNLTETFSAANSELCFQCHKARLATNRTTTKDTGFRNGDMNLHEFHLSGQKKEHTCRACHEVHSSTQAKLIRQTFSYKDYQLPIQFTVLDNGGKCATACHHDMTYNREKAFKNEPR